MAGSCAERRTKIEVFVLFIQLRLRTMLAWKFDDPCFLASTMAEIKIAEVLIRFVVDWVSMEMAG